MLASVNEVKNMDDNPAEYSVSLDAIEWSDNNYNLSTFLDQYGTTLPHIVKVNEGFCGVASSCTIDSGQCLILHAVHKETKIIAKDSKDYDLFIPENFPVKVEMVPKNSFPEYTTIQELLRTFPNFFRLQEDIPSLEVSSGSIFKILRENTFTNHIECLQIGEEESKGKMKFPLALEGRFQPLLDSRELFLDEVFMDDSLPVTVHFVKSSNTCLIGNKMVSLHELGNIRLIGECETESVFATIHNNNGKTLAVFPKNLNITVLPPISTADTYKKCQEDVLKNQEKTLKRINRLNKLGLYQAKNPIRQFPTLEILPPVLPKLRSQSLFDSKDRCHEGTSDLTKERSNSTPPQPPIPPKSTTMKCPQEKCSTKILLKASYSAPPTSPLKKQNNIKDKKLPSHKPPPIPSNQAPPLPIKEKNKVKQSLETPPKSPTTPTPPPRRKRKTCKRPEILEESVDSHGYIQMAANDMIRNYEYETMSPPFLSSSPASANNDPNKTLEEMFGVVEPQGTKNRNAIIFQGECIGVDFNHNTAINEYSKGDTNCNDHGNMTKVCFPEVRDDDDTHDYENTKGINIPGTAWKHNQILYDHEDNKVLETSTLSGQSFDKSLNIENAFHKEIASANAGMHKKRHAYENTGHLNKDVPKEAANITLEDRNVTEGESLNNLGCLNTPHKSKTVFCSNNISEMPCSVQAMDDHPSYENTSSLKNNGEKMIHLLSDDKTQFQKSQCNQNMTMTEQLVSRIAQKRPNPIGMEQIMHEEVEYTNMDENNLRGNLNNVKQNRTFEENDGACYVAMNDSFCDSEIYENETLDGEYTEPTDLQPNKRDSFYEEIDLPLPPREPTMKNRNQGDGFSKEIDMDELHYHEVDLSMLALPYENPVIQDDGDVYEDIDVPQAVTPSKSQQIPHRPTPPSRRVRPHRTMTMSDGELPFGTPPTSPPKLSNSLDSKLLSNHKNSAPDQSEFVELDDLRIQLAKIDSMKEIKEANIRRPPAPPPKKLNYVKVDTMATTTEMPTNKPFTNYSDIVGTEKPEKHNKDMENRNDCGPYLVQTDKPQIEMERKANLQRVVEEMTTQAIKPKDVEQDYEIPDLHNIKEAMDNVSCESVKQPLKPILPKPKPVEKPRNLSIKPIVPKKPTKKRENSSSSSPINSENIDLLNKKRALLPPPKPKRLFLNNEQTENIPEVVKATEMDKQSPNDSPSHRQRDGTQKKPLPLPRKKT